MIDPRETLARIRAQADAATDGPWEAGDRYRCQAADMCECSPDRGPLIDTYQHPTWGTMHVHRSAEPWWDGGVLFRRAGEPPGDVGRDLAREDAEFIAAARTNVPQLLEALEAVLEVHAPVPCTITDGTGVTEGTVCDSCMTHEWPCPTVKAITTTLNGDNV